MPLRTQAQGAAQVAVPESAIETSKQIGHKIHMQQQRAQKEYTESTQSKTRQTEIDYY